LHPGFKGTEVPGDSSDVNSVVSADEFVWLDDALAKKIADFVVDGDPLSTADEIVGVMKNEFDLVLPVRSLRSAVVVARAAARSVAQLYQSITGLERARVDNDMYRSLVSRMACLSTQPTALSSANQTDKRMVVISTNSATFDEIRLPIPNSPLSLGSPSIAACPAQDPTAHAGQEGVSTVASPPTEDSAGDTGIAGDDVPKTPIYNQTTDDDDFLSALSPQTGGTERASDKYARKKATPLPSSPEPEGFIAPEGLIMVELDGPVDLSLPSRLPAFRAMLGLISATPSPERGNRSNIMRGRTSSPPPSSPPPPPPPPTRPDVTRAQQPGRTAADPPSNNGDGRKRSRSPRAGHREKEEKNRRDKSSGRQHSSKDRGREDHRSEHRDDPRRLGHGYGRGQFRGRPLKYFYNYKR
jgi:hypothetical protein